MSTFNYPNAATGSETPAPRPPKSDYRNVVYTLLTAGLLGSLGYIWYSKKNEKDADVKQEQQLVAANTKTQDSEASYQAALVRLDSITNLNTSLNSEISNKDGRIESLKREIDEFRRKGKLDARDEAQLQSKINALNREIDKYRGRVAELEAQNASLTEENTMVKGEREQVRGELEVTKTDFENTKVVKKQLEEQVDIGSTLTANNFNIAGVDERRSGKEKTTAKAKKVDKLRIGFDLDANRISGNGKKKIYVSITDPEGQPISVDALGSGKMNTREEGEKFFTTTMDVDYTQGQKKNISFDWKQEDFKKGDYRVEVYQNGFKIGEGKVTLKKGGLFG
jgi:predicted  nucleic acid-binding Zn-ribbon protein